MPVLAFFQSLGPYGAPRSDAQALGLLTAIMQSSSAIIALVLTANILFTQLQVYTLPARFLALWDRQTKAIYVVLATSALLPALLILFHWYALSDVALVLFALTLVSLGLYIRSRPKSVALDRFFNEMVTRPKLRASSARDLHQMSLAALDRSDLDTFRKACLLLFSVDTESEALYEFWNDILSRTQDEPAAITPLAEAVYVCGSPIGVSNVIEAAAKPHPTLSRATAVNLLYSPILTEQAPHYLARMLLVAESAEPGRRTLVRQEVVENMLLLLLDLLTVGEDGRAGDNPASAAAIVATLLGYLEDVDETLLLPALSGGGIYHYLFFDVPGAERLAAATLRELDEGRRRSWDRIVGHLYHERRWRDRPDLRIALWRDGGTEPEVLTDGEAVEAIAGGPGDDGLPCHHTERRCRLLLTP
jgi:hypothetical protein